MINGIKPMVSTKAQLSRLDVSNFEAAMNNLLDKLTENAKPYVTKFDHMSDVVFKTDGGRKFIKVKHYTTYKRGDATYPDAKDKGRIHCFVDKTTGDIYKPATWRAPYTKGKNAVRGNIYDPNTYQKTDLYGGWLYHK